MRSISSSIRTLGKLFTGFLRENDEPSFQVGFLALICWTIIINIKMSHSQNCRLELAGEADEQYIL